MAHVVLNAPSEGSSSEIADWLEIVMLATARRILSPGKARDLLETSGIPVEELDVALAFSVLHSRCDRDLRMYPFRFSRLGLERQEDIGESPYAFLVLLAASSDGGISLGAPAEAAVLLERLVAASLRRLFGEKSSVVRFGHPPELGRPAEFNSAITWLAGRLNARPLPLAGNAFLRNDGGIDVVCWRNFDDRHPGPIAAVQVSSGADLRGKSLEIAGNDLERWIRIARPMAILASPIDGDRDPDLVLEIGTRVLLLDRWRLLECLGETELEGAELAQWTSSALETVLI